MKGDSMNKLRKHSGLIAIVLIGIALFLGLEILRDMAIKDARVISGVIWK